MNQKVSLHNKKHENSTIYKSKDGQVFCAKSSKHLVTMMRQDSRVYSFEDNYDYMVFCKENTQAWNGVELDITSEEKFVSGLISCGLITIHLSN